jgi:hypothetical protein
MSKTLWISLSIIGILLLGGIIFFSLNQKNQSILNFEGSTNYYISQTSASTNYYTYSLSAIQDYAVPGKGGGYGDYKIYYNIDETLTWTNPISYSNINGILNFQLPSDIQYNKEFTTTDVTASGTFGKDNNWNDVSIAYKDMKSVCTVLNKDSISCRVTGMVYSTQPCTQAVSYCYDDYSGNLAVIGSTEPRQGFRMFGQPQTQITVNLLKQGIECLDNSYCSSGSCINNLCSDPLVEEVVTQADVEIVQEELIALNVDDIPTSEVLSNETLISEISANTGFSEDKVKFILEADKGMSKTVMVIIILSILSFLIVLMVIGFMLTKRKK